MLLLAILATGALHAQEAPAEPNVTEVTERNEDNLPITATEPEGEADSPSAGLMQSTSAEGIFRMLIALAIVLAIIYVIYAVMKKVGGQRFVPSEFFKLKGSYAVSPGKNLHLIEVGNQIFLIGAAENSLNLISEITDGETIDQIRLIEEPGRVPLSFAKLIGKKMNRENVEEEDRATPVGSADYVRKQKERLQKMRGGRP